MAGLRPAALLSRAASRTRAPHQHGETVLSEEHPKWPATRRRSVPDRLRRRSGPAGKRALDLGLAALAGVLLLPVALLIAAAIALIDGRPVLYGSERMRAPGRAFTLWKFRTMRPDAADAGVTGADKADRITRTGRFLRASRADEIPQVWNVLRGEMSLVGPRPPLRRYVEMFPDLYGAVLESRPGLTGLATLVFHRHEARILARCRTGAETERAYIRRCVPRKARLDLLYARHRSICFDLAILGRTLLRR